jgi:hypothetical protein
LICQKSDTLSPLKQASIKVYVKESNYEYLANLSEREFDVVIFADWYLAKIYYGFVKKYYQKAKIVIDAANLQFIRDEQLITSSNKYVRAISSGEIIKNKDEELEMYALADVCWVSSRDEKNILKKYAPMLEIEIIPTIYNTGNKMRENYDINTAYFIGSSSRQSDVDAGSWFIQEIFDLIKNENLSLGHFTVTFIGDFDQSFKEKNKKDGIIYKTHRDIEYDIDFCLKQFEVCLLPIRFCSGVDERLVQAILNGIPVITTSVVASGLNLSDDDVILCDSPELFVQGIKNLRCGVWKSNMIKHAKNKFCTVANLAEINENIFKHL